MQLTRSSLPSSAGFSGCGPLWLRRMLDHQLDWLGLPDCRNDASATPATPAALEPTYTLTVIAGEGGNINPPGNHHAYRGRPGHPDRELERRDAHVRRLVRCNCSGAATTCVLEMYANASVTAAFTPLPADRCASPTDADCIRRRLQRPPGRLRPGPGHPRLGPPPPRRTTAATWSSGDNRSPSSRRHDYRRGLQPLLPALAPRKRALADIVAATRPSRRDDLHIHRQRKRTGRKFAQFPAPRRNAPSW